MHVEERIAVNVQLPILRWARMALAIPGIDRHLNPANRPASE